MTNIIKLPKPEKNLEFPLMKALENRRSKRKWKSEPLSEQEVANLLWAACGVTKPETKRCKSKRTAPSGCNSQSIKIYVALPHGLFRYDETAHSLIKISPEDIRANIGTQKMMHSAPVGLIYVSDYSKMNSILFKNEERKRFISGADAAFISQNVYLYCAAAKLSTVVIALVNREKLHRVMCLKEHEKIVYTQAVGKSLDE